MRRTLLPAVQWHKRLADYTLEERAALPTRSLGLKGSEGVIVSKRVMALLTVPLAGLILVSPAAAENRGDAAAGRQLAERWCAECHMVAPDQMVATPDVPTFMQIAEDADDNLAVLAGFLMDPHPPMPDLSLTRQEIRNLIAYFAALRRGRD